MTIEKQIYKMLTTSTGIHMLDSGGDNGRNWQRNKIKTVDDFRNEAEAIIELNQYSENEFYINAYVSVFHYLVNALATDKLCYLFNKKKVSDWNGDIYGVSELGQRWIDKHFNKKGESWNTYNWDCPLSQTLQGQLLTCKTTNKEYVLIQIHQGADVRGGYTNAKLFLLNTDSFLSCDLSCDYFDYLGNEAVNHDGYSLSDDDIKEIAKNLGVTKENTVAIPAHLLT